MPKVTARATILSLLTLCSIAHSQVNTLPTTPYLAKNATRYYFLNELDSCPGVLDMQAGDLWTITFPENISNYFLTRPGMIEAKAQDNRLILTPLTNTGTVPLLVITENNLAPKFMITVKAGTGGRLKDVQVLSGTPTKITCPISVAPSTATQIVTTSKSIPTRSLNTRQAITPALTVTKKTPTTLETSPGTAPTVTNPQVSTNSTAHHPIPTPLVTEITEPLLAPSPTIAPAATDVLPGLVTEITTPQITMVASAGSNQNRPPTRTHLNLQKRFSLLPLVNAEPLLPPYSPLTMRQVKF